jgi:hypothetical protein
MHFRTAACLTSPTRLREKMWKDAGDSKEACNEALRGLFEAKAKISSASEKHLVRVNHQ